MAPSDTHRWRLDSEESNSETICSSSFVGVKNAKTINLQNHNAYSHVHLFEAHSIFRNPEDSFLHGFPSITAARPLGSVYSDDDEYEDKENYLSVATSTLIKATDDAILFLTEPLNEIEGRGYILPWCNQSSASLYCKGF